MEKIESWSRLVDAGIKISVAIDDREYMDRTDIIEGKIPFGVRSIGNRAFANCSNLKRIEMADSIISIGDSAFNECVELEEIVLSNKLEHIGYCAFANCKKLKRIVIPESIDTLNWGLFAGCDSLEEIVLPNSIIKMDKQLCIYCKRLTKINIPTSITTIPEECFKGCKKLDIEIPERITKIEDSAFEDCYKMTHFPSHKVDFGKNAFKNCRSLTSVTIHEDCNNQYNKNHKQICNLPDGLFEGCFKLTEINYSKPRGIGKRFFKNCRSLKKIPEWVTTMDDKAFEKCIGLTTISLKDSTVPFACFRGCKNLKTIKNFQDLYHIKSFAFSGCESLEKIRIDELKDGILSPEVFSNCKNLKEVSFTRDNNIERIGSRAFFNCPNLKSIRIPKQVKLIGKEAFKQCNSITSINIPKALEQFSSGAFSYMDSLERINVSRYNKNFTTPDHKILIENLTQKLVLYASGLKEPTYSLGKYNYSVEGIDRDIIRPIQGIGEYAFAGAKNLSELTLCACTQDIDATAFYGCNNLKKLTVKAIPCFSVVGFNIRNNGLYYIENNKMKVFLPFEELVLSGPIASINSSGFAYFNNLTNIEFNIDKNFDIGLGAFAHCEQLSEVSIPRNARIISDSFPENTVVKFENGLSQKGFESLNFYDQYKGNYNLYSFKNGDYYVEQGDIITKITEKQIENKCSNASHIKNNPVLYIDFLNDLKNNNLVIKPLLNGILMANISLTNRDILFNGIKQYGAFILDILQNSKLLEKDNIDTKFLLSKNNMEIFMKYVDILKTHNISDSIFHNNQLMSNLKPEYFENYIEHDYELFRDTLTNSRLFEKENDKLTIDILGENLIGTFMETIKDKMKNYDFKDKFIFNKVFISAADEPLLKDMIKLYDGNIKRLIKESEILEDELSASQNLSDLLILMKITGALEDDPIIKQRGATFIIERMFNINNQQGKLNESRIVGNDIHRIFNFPYTREEFDLEFANFFIENYEELYLEEKKTAGFIQRVYLNFREISRTCTSNKGSQRKLKVTMDKCRNFLSNVKFDGVSKEDEPFAELLAKWYDTNKIWLDAQRVYHESLNARRNIFTKDIITKDKKILHDNDPKKDLREIRENDFTYEWLPKQNYDNLILGKLCNCCAHISGAGQGIMRASMILNDCQNLVVRNEEGLIIAKSTLYVNRMKGYAVYNNVESSFNYRSQEDIRRIYDAFIRGSKAFFETYNKNNEIKLTEITIGANRNTLAMMLNNDKIHPEVPILESIKFGNYALTGSGYSGDWDTLQRLVISSKKAYSMNNKKDISKN